MVGKVTDRAAQIAGGYALIEEYDVGRFCRDRRALRRGEGNSASQRVIILRRSAARVRDAILKRKRALRSTHYAPNPIGPIHLDCRGGTPWRDASKLRCCASRNYGVV